MRRDESNLQYASRLAYPRPRLGGRTPFGIVRAMLGAAAALAAASAAAAQYIVSDETGLRQAYASAGASTDPTATIVLSGNITLADPAPLPLPSKPVTINTNGFTLQNDGTIANPGNNPIRLNTGSSFLNMGVIQGNISATVGGTHIINDGTIGGTIMLGGANNVLELRAGSNITQNAVRTVNASGTNDTLALGGSADSGFNVAQLGGVFPLPLGKYQSFENFQKTGSSIWTLSGSTQSRTPWQLMAGTLSISSDANLGGSAGSLTFDGGALRNTASFTSARAVTINGNGGTFENMADLTWSGTISGTGGLDKRGAAALILTADSGAFTGTTTVESGVLAVNGRLCGAMRIGSGGTLGGSGTVCGTSNAGTIAPGNSIGTLTINGDYAGNGGTLRTEAVLGGDNSPADKLVVTGNTSGSTLVQVINRGGTGARTVNGIKIVDIGGVSAGTFTLVGDYAIAGQPAVVAGAYAYTLQKNGISTPGDGDWYLRSSLTNPPAGTDPVVPPSSPGTPGTPDAPGTPSTPATPGVPAPPPAMQRTPIYQPGVPVYEAYPSMLLDLNAPQTLRQRTGGQYRTAGGDTSPDAAIGPSGPTGSGVWARTEGQQGRLRPGTSTAGTTTDFDLWKLQIGTDRSLAETTHGRLVAGLNAQYGTLSSRVDSDYGRGDIDTTAYGIGATLTWYGDHGFYVDSQARLNWFDSTLSSRTLGRTLAKGNDGKGYALSVETGKRIAVEDGWGVTPQAQLVYSRVNFSSFVDPYGARVSSADTDSLTGRLGMTIDYRHDTPDGTGKKQNSVNLYGGADLYYEFLDGTAVNVSDVRAASSAGRAAVGILAGASYSWTKDRYTVYGEIGGRTGLNDFGGSYGYTGTVGVRVRF